MTELTQQRLKEVLSYDHENGLFTWAVSIGTAKRGSIAGYKHLDGYIQIMIDGKNYRAHRLAWLYVYGNFPEKDLDHINEIKDNNRICNLRLATRQKNTHNQSKPRIHNISGFRGVCWCKSSKKWKSQIGINGKKKYLGIFNTAEEAYEAYLKAKRELHLFWVEDKVA